MLQKRRQVFSINIFNKPDFWGGSLPAGISVSSLKLKIIKPAFLMDHLTFLW
jgi:hypothetical protein